MKFFVFFAALFGAYWIQPIFAEGLETSEQENWVTISCQVSGLLADKPSYRIIVDGVLVVDTNAIGRDASAEKAVQESLKAYVNKYLYNWTEEEQKQALENVCIPVGQRSKIFGEADGTRLQISAWRCHNSSSPYFYQQVILNGLPPIGAYLKEGASRLLFGLDRVDKPGLVSAPTAADLHPERTSPLSLPEGEFKFIYSDCKMK